MTKAAEVFHYGYPLCVTDAGRSLSRWPKEDNDCAVRSLVHATGLDYETCHEVCKKAGRKYHTGIEIRWYRKPGWFLSEGKRFIFQEIKFPAVVATRRMNPPDFVKQFPKGRYILNEGAHVEAAVDGVIYDDRLRTHKKHKLKTFRCIYSAFKVHEVPEGHKIYRAYRGVPGGKGRTIGLVHAINKGSAIFMAATWYGHRDDETIKVKALSV